MKKTKLILSILSITFLLSCGSTDKGKSCADSFFNHVISEKYDSALILMENMSLSDSTSFAKMKIFGNNPDFGKLISAEKGFGFNTNVSNGITTVRLPYKLKYENVEVSREVTIVDRGNGYKIKAIE
ncbi:MAG: hypothetical protein ACPGVD_02840 [Flavobacteriales bacterium]